MDERFSKKTINLLRLAEEFKPSPSFFADLMEALNALEAQGKEDREYVEHELSKLAGKMYADNKALEKRVDGMFDTLDQHRHEYSPDGGGSWLDTTSLVMRPTPTPAPEPVCETCGGTGWKQESRTEGLLYIQTASLCPSCQPAKSCGSCTTSCSHGYMGVVCEQHSSKPATEEGEKERMFKIKVDSTIPPNEVHLKQGGDIVGKIVNVNDAPKPQGEAWYLPITKDKEGFFVFGNGPTRVCDGTGRAIGEDALKRVDIHLVPGYRMERAMMIIQDLLESQTATFPMGLRERCVKLLKEAE